jgi:3-hydroxyacyl-CoA dehydrogenase
LNPVSYTTKDNLAIVTIDHPPVNAMSLSVRAGLAEAIQAATADGRTQGIIRCEGRTFVAGGDISEFGKPPQEPHLPDVYQQLEDSPVTWVAAMHGTVLGGGFELAMACDFRIATAGTRFGLPEVTLGLVPGAGGTQRLPRLLGTDVAGLELAVDLCCSGRMISASELLEVGGLDAIVDNNLDDAASAFLQSPSAAQQPVAVSKRSIVSVPADFFQQQQQKH